jgi:hypothetical protein
MRSRVESGCLEGLPQFFEDAPARGLVADYLDAAIDGVHPEANRFHVKSSDGPAKSVRLFDEPRLAV